METLSIGEFARRSRLSPKALRLYDEMGLLLPARGRRSTMYEVQTREILNRSVLCLKRNVDGESGAWAFGKEFVALFKDRPAPRMEGRVGAAFCIWWGEVTDDSDGPLEWCRPVPDEQAETLAADFPELSLRVEPAHQEAFVDLGPGGETSPVQWQLISESLHAWGEERGIRSSELGVRITYLATPPRTEKSVPIATLLSPFDPRSQGWEGAGGAPGSSKNSSSA